MRFQVSDLLAHPGQARDEAGSVRVHVELANASVDTDVEVGLSLRSLSDGVVVRGTAHTVADVTCIRCLTQWSEPLEVPIEVVYRTHPDDEDDELPIDSGGWIDLEPVAHDEVALALPTRPLCRQDCLGLCPTCGNDLNVESCDGHGDQSESPFSALQQLFARESSEQPES